MTLELRLSAERIRILGMVHRKRRVVHLEELRLGCSGSVVGNLGSKVENVAFNWMIRGKSGWLKNAGISKLGKKKMVVVGIEFWRVGVPWCELDMEFSGW